MFKVGDVVVCIDNGDNVGITLYKKYTIAEVHIILDNSCWVSVISNFNRLDSYFAYRFINLSEYRKNKIKKICSKLETE